MKPGFSERKFGMFGTKRFVYAEVALIAGVVETSWLRWFVSASLIGGCLVAVILRHINHEPLPPVVELKDDTHPERP